MHKVLQEFAQSPDRLEKLSKRVSLGAIIGFIAVVALAITQVLMRG